MNVTLARSVLESLAQQGVRDVVLCAGARNSPFVVLLEKAHGFRVWNFFEERSAGFFALGRAQRDQRPVAVITTSGTAVAELLPVAVEATYSPTPLILVTADRPRSYRGKGAPQSIDQVGIFFKYVETCIDLAHPDEKFDLSLWSRQSPLQINVSFQEPLIDEEVPEVDFSNSAPATTRSEKLYPPASKVVEQPIVIAGPLSVEETREVAPFLEKLGAPIYAEALSNLRHEPALGKFLLRSGEKIVSDLFIKGYCHSLIRIGGVPTLRFWRDLEDRFQHIPVVSVAASDFTGLSRQVQHFAGFHCLQFIKSQWTKDQRSQIFELDQKKTKALDSLLEKFPRSEPGLLARLARQIPAQSVYLGNSLPVREWDLVSRDRDVRYSGNRGANGIDGQVSSFLGGAGAEGENWAFLGDLTAMYDLAALWITPHLENSRLRLVVINNQGGQIFKNIFGKDIFLNRHQIEFSHWAQMWNWSYQKWTDLPSTLELPNSVIVELCPDAHQTDLFWQEYASL